MHIKAGKEHAGKASFPATALANPLIFLIFAYRQAKNFRALHRNTNSMKKILFVCHGNICRSPMAEFVMKDLVSKAGRAADFYIESAATSTEEIGNPVYPATRRKLAEHGIACDGKRARQLTRADYERFDLLVGMDSWNIRNMKAICVDDTLEGIRCHGRKEVAQSVAGNLLKSRTHQIHSIQEHSQCSK